MSSVSEFALDGELPCGATVLEASAGTGKTFAIAALAVRFIAETGRRVSELMIVTFSRNATVELRTRVFERLVSSRAALRAYRADGVVPVDPVDQKLCEPAALLDERIARLDDAISEFDDATIRTTHEFCRTMLGELGVLADHDQSARLADDIADIVEDATADTYIWMFAAEQTAPMTVETATRIGRAVAVKFPTVELSDEDSVKNRAAHAFAGQVRQRVEYMKRQRGLYTFDDMVTRLQDALRDPDTGPQAATLLAHRFPVVLIDEFQDTDPAQWDIVRRAFVGRSTVVLIGDPKQSIYAFRNADIHAYLEAVADIGQVKTLSTNYRADRPLVEAVSALFRGATLGDPRIVVRRVNAHHPRRAHTPPGSGWDAPLRVRAINHDLPIWWRQCHELIEADAAVQVIDLLNAGITVDDADGRRPLQARDVAVLVQSNDAGKAIYAELSRLGQAAVFTGSSSVYDSEAAHDWRVLLAALSEPRHNLNSRAALTSLLGWSAQRLAAASGEDRDDVTLTMARLTRLIAASGVAGVFAWLEGHTDLYKRLLSTPDGERRLTDLRHLAEELDAAQRTRRLSPAALLDWLDDRTTLAQQSDGSAQRRIETDRDAVQIMTIHRAKGLAFGYVFLPEAGRGPYAPTDQPFVHHQDGRRVLNLGIDVYKKSEAALDHQAEAAGESLRKLYVGLTRARFGATVWWFNTADSPLQRLLYAHQGPGREPGSSFASMLVPPDQISLDPRMIRCERVEEGVTPRPRLPLPEEGELAAQGFPPEYRPFERTIDRGWTRTSYSGLTADAHELAPIVGNHEPDEADDAELVAGSAVTPQQAAGQSSLVALPGGTTFGSVVHGVLEEVDPASDSVREDMADAATRLLARLPVPGLDAEPLVDGLVQVVHTPLGPLTGGRSLADLGAANRLAELEFEMPLSLASSTAWRPTVADLAALWNDPRMVPDDDPLRGYGQHLAASPAAQRVLAGFLTGSIDVVLRVGEADRLRYVVLDYKTNRIPVPPGEALGSHHYTQAAMADAMIASHYPLQALLYSVALHRMLTVRQPGYAPHSHLGGVGYLFVRGMCGAGTPMDDGLPQGVFTWLPTAELVVAASDILGGHEEGR